MNTYTKSHPMKTRSADKLSFGSCSMCVHIPANMTAVRSASLTQAYTQVWKITVFKRGFSTEP